MHRVTTTSVAVISLTARRIARAPALSLLLAVLAAASSFPVSAFAAPAEARSPTYKLDIPAQDLNDALQALALISRHRLLYSSKLVDGKRSSTVKGELTTEEAIRQLLVGTGLKYEITPDGLVMIWGQNGSADGMSTSGAQGAGDRATQMARVGAHSDVSAGHDGASGTAQAAAMAQEQGGAEGSATKVEEIVVTAQKRAERLIDVPISMVALTADDLRKRKVTSIDDLAQVAPGVALTGNGSQLRAIYIRGVGNVYGSSNLTGIYLDEATTTSPYPARQLDLRTYDLERIEVLRGPQGTLYGEGAVGGTIRFITRNPELDRFAMKADVAGFFVEDGAPGQQIESMVNVPLVRDKLGVRLAASYEHGGGWIDQPAAGKKDINDQDLVDIRLKGLWQPSPQLVVNAMAVISRKDAPPNYGEDADGNFTQFFNQATTPDTESDYDLYNLTLSYDFSSVRVLSTSSYVDQKVVFEHTGQRAVTSFSPGSRERHTLYDRYVPGGRVFTEELRLTSNGSGRWQWTIGAFYQDIYKHDYIPGYYSGVVGAPGSPLPGPFTYLSITQSRSDAAFGDVSYQLTDRITLGSGLRYFRDDQDYVLGTGVLDPPPLGPQQTARFHALNPRFYAQYKVSAGVNTYVSASKGFRSGGINNLNQPNYDPESVWTYELGTKMSLAEGRLTGDAAVFYTDYQGYQINGIVATSSGQTFGIVSNAGDARIRGIELALTWHPSQSWSLGLNGDYLDAKFVEVNTLPNPLTGLPTSGYIVGDSIGAIPPYQLAVFAQRDFSLNDRRGFARLDYSQQGRMTYRSRNTGPLAFAESDIINMLNLNVGLQWNDRLSLGLFGQNLLDDRGFTSAFWLLQNGGRSRPRSYGIQFGVDFD